MTITPRRRTGNLGEDVAVQYLEMKGFTVLVRNYLKPWGEIDIIAEKGNTVRFVEVKSVTREIESDISRERSHDRARNEAEEHVHPAKLKKLARTAEIYMNATHDNRDFQIDVVSVYLDISSRRARCALYEQVL